MLTVKEQLLQKLEEFKLLLEQAQCDGKSIMQTDSSVRDDITNDVSELEEAVGYYVDN